jgi:hypothetical protein
MILSRCHMENVYCVHDHWVCRICYLPCVTMSVLDLARECAYDAGSKAQIKEFVGAA